MADGSGAYYDMLLTGRSNIATDEIVREYSYLGVFLFVFFACAI